MHATRERGGQAHLGVCMAVKSLFPPPPRGQAQLGWWCHCWVGAAEGAVWGEGQSVGRLLLKGARRAFLTVRPVLLSVGSAWGGVAAGVLLQKASGSGSAVSARKGEAVGRCSMGGTTAHLKQVVPGLGDPHSTPYEATWVGSSPLPPPLRACLQVKPDT